MTTTPDAVHGTRAESFAELDPDLKTRWSNFLSWEDKEYYPSRMGLELLDLRTDYCRVKLPWDERNTQPAGVIHGGAIATIVDTVVVPAIGTGYPIDAMWSTIELHVQYHRALTTDAYGEGWVVRRGRSVVFTRAEVTDPTGTLIASGTATYAVKQPQS